MAGEISTWQFAIWNQTTGELVAESLIEIDHLSPQNKPLILRSARFSGALRSGDAYRIRYRLRDTGTPVDPIVAPPDEALSVNIVLVKLRVIQATDISKTALFYPISPSGRDAETLSGDQTSGYGRWRPADWNTVESIDSFEISAKNGSAGATHDHEMRERGGGGDLKLQLQTTATALTRQRGVLTQPLDANNLENLHVLERRSAGSGTLTRTSAFWLRASRLSTIDSDLSATAAFLIEHANAFSTRSSTWAIRPVKSVSLDAQFVLFATNERDIGATWGVDVADRLKDVSAGFEIERTKILDISAAYFVNNPRGKDLFATFEIEIPGSIDRTAVFRIGVARNVDMGAAFLIVVAREIAAQFRVERIDRTVDRTAAWEITGARTFDRGSEFRVRGGAERDIGAEFRLRAERGKNRASAWLLRFPASTVDAGAEFRVEDTRTKDAGAEFRVDAERVQDRNAEYRIAPPGTAFDRGAEFRVRTKLHQVDSVAAWKIDAARSSDRTSAWVIAEVNSMDSSSTHRVLAPRATALGGEFRVDRLDVFDRTATHRIRVPRPKDMGSQHVIVRKAHRLFRTPVTSTMTLRTPSLAGVTFTTPPRSSVTLRTPTRHE